GAGDRVQVPEADVRIDPLPAVRDGRLGDDAMHAFGDGVVGVGTGAVELLDVADGDLRLERQDPGGLGVVPLLADGRPGEAEVEGVEAVEAAAVGRAALGAAKERGAAGDGGAVAPGVVAHRRGDA